MSSERSSVARSDVLQVLYQADPSSFGFQHPPTEPSVEPISNGVNDVFVVTPVAPDGEPVVIKFGTYSESRHLRAGVAAYRLFSQYTTLPVPTVYETDFNTDEFPPFVIMEYLPGGPLASGYRDTERITDLNSVRLLGTVINEFGRIPRRAADGYGFIRDVDDGDGTPSAIGDYDDCAEWLVDYATRYYANGSNHEALRSIVAAVPHYLRAHRDLLPSDPSPSVVITDLFLDNLLCSEDERSMNEDELTGMIDLERARVGPMEFTAVNAEYLLTRFVSDAESVQRALYDPLPFEPDMPARELYRLIAMSRSVNALPFWYEPGSETYRQRGNEIAAEIDRIVH